MDELSETRAVPDRGKLTLRGSRDAFTAGNCDETTAQEITKVLAAAREGGLVAADALLALQDVLEEIRHTAPGPDRAARMNAFVRTLGRADNLAQFVELLREAAKSPGDGVPGIVKRSRSDRGHCIYGWAGQSIILASATDTLPATAPPGEGVAEFMGYPLAEWHASIHIWQPNPEAVGFESAKLIEPGVIVEPPHSHPFSFASYVSVGALRQSIYEEVPGGGPTGSERAGDTSAAAAERYSEVVLERAGGVWPPHPSYQASRLRTAEERVLLEAGQSYHMTTSMIHDVEVERAAAAEKPAITLFLCSETTQIPDTYLVPAMADFHRSNADILKRAVPLEPQQWDAKLAALAAYLRGDTEHLRLGEIVRCGSSYAFMNT